MLARAKQLTKFRPLQLTQNEIQLLVKSHGTSLMSKLRSRQFLLAVHSKDLHGICQILNRLQIEEKDHGNPYPMTTHSAYFRCLDILFEFTSTSSSASSRSIVQFLHYITSYRPIVHTMTTQTSNVEHTNRVIEFKKNILVSMSKSLRDVSDPNYRSNSLKRYLEAIKLLQIDCDELLPLMDLDSRKIFQKVFNYSGKNIIEPVLKFRQSDGKETMTFNDLLGIIQERLPNAPKGKMYQIYDQLPESERELFMEKYLQFNTEKQHIIENNCQHLTLTMSNNLTKYSLPSDSERSVVASWLERFLMLLDYKLNSKNTMINFKTGNDITKDNKDNYMNEGLIPSDITSNANNDTQWVQKHLVLFKVIPTNELFSSALSTIMEMCRGTNQATLVNVASSFAPKTVRLCKRHGFNVDGFLDDKDLLLCLVTILSILVDSCEFLEGSKQVSKWEVENPYAATIFKNPKPFHIYNERKDGKTYSTIKLHPLVLELCPVLAQESSLKQLFLPMLCPPRPWMSVFDGGYLRNIHSVVFSTHQKTHLEFYKKAEQTGQMSTILSTISRLGDVPWMINPGIVDVFNAAMDLEAGFLSIPPKDFKEILKVPELHVLNREDFATDVLYQESRKKAFKRYMNALNKFNGLNGRRTKYENLRKLVEAYSINGDILYMPYGFDFRGRIYPMNNYLSHYDEDLTRSLLNFWKPEPLGPRGLEWLKYQLAGVYGHDKLPFDARIEFIDTNIDKIIESTINPLEHGKWWANGDKPWSTLSLCFELVKVLDYVEKGGKADDFKSRIPISMDGSCNGLQHYAALGADREGGEAVNLLPNEDRRDVYTAVLRKVEETLKSNVLTHSTNRSFVDRILLKIISRKIVKQTVMTSVYGVTMYGAKSQIQDKIDNFIELKDIHFEDTLTEKEWDFLENNRSEIASHIAKITLRSISSMFKHAKDIQNWLMVESIKLMKGIDKESIRNHQMTSKKQYDLLDLNTVHNFTPMLWTTMTGFPVVQLYSKRSTHTLISSRGALKFATENKITEVDRSKQVNGIAPNFIHSVDATHMQMACFEATDRNLTFISVHDSFWTYPKDVDTLNSIIRDTFVTLHSEDILLELYRELNEAVRGKYQLVYYKIDDNIEFHEAIQKLRLQYPKLTTKLHQKMIKECLLYEFKGYLESNKVDKDESSVKEKVSKDISTSKNLFIENYQEIIRTHQPDLFLRISAGKIVPYKSKARLSEVINDAQFKSGNVSKKWSMLVVPLIILDPPAKGDLDITGVLDNKYFFS